MDIYEWKDIKDEGYDALILGNGASIAVDPCFSYKSLYELMQKKKEFSGNIQSVFRYLETSDFEFVLNRIWHSHHINLALEINDEKTMEAYKEIRQSLIKAVRSNHVEYAYAEFHFESIYKFVRKFKTVISFNYDLILYWAMLYGNNQIGGTWFKDCFIHRDFCDDWESKRKPYGQVDGSTLVFYPHGNLILARSIYGKEYKLINRETGSGNLLEQIFACWEKGVETPLFVSEGDSEQKMRAIRRSAYLSEVYDNVLPKAGKRMVIYGWALAEQDKHIIKQVCNSSVEIIAVSIYMNNRHSEELIDEKQRMEKIIRKYNRSAEIIFFNSDSKGCWLNQ